MCLMSDTTTVLDDSGRTVDVGQEETDSIEALGQTELELPALVARKHARQEVDRDDAFVAVFIAIDFELNAFA